MPELPKVPDIKDFIEQKKSFDDFVEARRQSLKDLLQIDGTSLSKTKQSQLAARLRHQAKVGGVNSEAYALKAAQYAELQAAEVALEQQLSRQCFLLQAHRQNSADFRAVISVDAASSKKRKPADTPAARPAKRQNADSVQVPAGLKEHARSAWEMVVGASKEDPKSLLAHRVFCSNVPSEIMKLCPALVNTIALPPAEPNPECSALGAFGKLDPAMLKNAITEKYPIHGPSGVIDYLKCAVQDLNMSPQDKPVQDILRVFDEM
ncbi:hypothetical protein HDU88_005716 [Geranomyces variabilis]|nr:hypothetical protein HDU88_005716 [Geranomyces variabilis]